MWEYFMLCKNYARIKKKKYLKYSFCVTGGFRNMKFHMLVSYRYKWFERAVPKKLEILKRAKNLFEKHSKLRFL